MIYVDSNGVVIDMPSFNPELDEKFDGIEIAISESLGEEL